MIFLIEYSRSQGKLVKMLKFSDDQRTVAENRRLELELGLNRKKIDHEVVVLEAASEEALHKTHRRYFQDSAQIAESFGKQ
jgi:hypothetical protein